MRNNRLWLWAEKSNHPDKCQWMVKLDPLHKDTTAESCSSATLSFPHSLSQGLMIRFGRGALEKPQLPWQTQCSSSQSQKMVIFPSSFLVYFPVLSKCRNNRREWGRSSDIKEKLQDLLSPDVTGRHRLVSQHPKHNRILEEMFNSTSRAWLDE